MVNFIFKTAFLLSVSRRQTADGEAHETLTRGGKKKN